MDENQAYNRDVVVHCLSRHFETLARMGYLEVSDIQYAPPGGWDDSMIDSESLRTMGRNETVIDLLRNIPYLKHPYEVFPETRTIQYLGRMWDDDIVAQKMTKSRSLLGFYPLMPFDAEPEPGMVCLTYGREGVWWLVDTTEGYIYPCGPQWTVQRGEEDPPWLWYQPVTISKYFEKIHLQLLSLNLIPLPHVIHVRKRGSSDELEHQIYKEGEQEAIPVKQIFHDHGWPNFDIFRKEDCIKAANVARLKVVEKRTFRWHEEEIRKAENCGDIEEKEESEMRLRNAQIEYNHEWD